MVKRKVKKKIGAVTLSDKKTPVSLKPENKIVKKPTIQKSTEERVKITHQVTGDNGEKNTDKGDKQVKNVVERNGSRNMTSSQTGNKKNHEEKNRRDNKADKNIGGSTAGDKEKHEESSRMDKKAEKNLGGLISENKEKCEESSRSDKKAGKNLGGLVSGSKEKREESSRRDKKAEKNLGGLILMCNRKTKSDCFRYQIMGVPANKQDIVTSIKPGLHLFLYDFDLRLLYGIYVASSAGGMKLEPAAFGGSFPAQVRFQVYKDCLPLPESVFKMAIKDGYDERTHKFKPELTVEQVRKLTELFQPVQLFHSDPNSSLQPAHLLGEEDHSGRSYRDHYTTSNTAGHHIPNNHENPIMEHYIPPRNVASPNPLFLSEKEYRSYGLKGERHTPVAAFPIAEFDHYRANLEQPQTNHSETFMQKESSGHSELFLSEKEYRAYGLKGRSEMPQKSATMEYIPPLDSYPDNMYNPYHDSTTSLVNRYLSLPVSVAGQESFNMASRDTYINDNRSNPGRVPPREGERLYQTYAPGAYHHLGDETGSRSAPVSSRYSFAGPSVSYR